MPEVLVTDASERAALAVIRSLGSKGIGVTAGDSISFNTGFLSKYCKHRVLYPPPEKDREKFVKYLLKLVKENEYALLMPITDFTVIPLSKHKEEFEPYVKMAVPPYEVALKAFDKAEMIKLVAKVGIPHPKTFFIEDIEKVETIAKEIEYPAVIKPRTKIFWVNNSAITMKVTPKNYAYDPYDLITKYAKIVSEYKGLVKRNYLPMIQEYVPGPGYGVEALIHNSKPKAVFIHKRLREYPITGGASTLRISVKDEKLMTLGIKVLNAMHWQGVAMVEFKVDERNREAKLIEVNGRFWGSLPLALTSGVDFPYLLYKTMVSGESFQPPNYKVGVKQRWLIPGDLLWLLFMLIYGKNKLHSVMEFIKSSTIPDDMISLEDAQPLIGAINTALHYFTDALLGRRGITGETRGYRS